MKKSVFITMIILTIILTIVLGPMLLAIGQSDIPQPEKAFVGIFVLFSVLFFASIIFVPIFLMLEDKYY